MAYYDAELPNVYKDIFDHFPDAVVSVSLDGLVVNCNRVAVKIFGYREDELRGRRASVLMKTPHSEIFDAYVLKYKRYMFESNDSDSDLVDYNCKKIRALKQSGDEFFVQMSTSVANTESPVIIVVIRDLSQVDELEELKMRDLEEKNMFATNISHELRTPLNSIINSNYILSQDIDRLSGKVSEELYFDIHDGNDTIRRNCIILQSLINDTLDYSKLDSKRVVLRRKPFSLRECVETCVDIHTTAAQAKGIEFVSSIGSDVPDDLIGDHERLTQIMMNLLSNAIKFTDEGKVSMIVSIDPDSPFPRDPKVITLVVRVRDTGIGIAEEDRPKLFRLFTQLETTDHAKKQGTGLGLAICKKICHLMGGDVVLESSKVDYGSVFTFRVRVGVEKPHFVKKLHQRVDVGEISGKQVLVVDDDENNIITFSQYLIDWGLKPITSTSGRAALVFVSSGTKFDLALIDIRMQRMGGLELARRMRELGVKYPLVALSSCSDVKDPDGVFNEVVMKPVIKNKLLRVVHKMLTTKINDLRSRSNCPHDMSSSSSSGEISQYSSTENLSGWMTPTPSPVVSGMSSRISTLSVASASACTRPVVEDKSLMRIAIVEDNPDHQKITAKLISRAGYNTPEIFNHGEAFMNRLQAAGSKVFDLVFLDIHMPIMGGLETAAKVRSMIEPRDQPFLIALTAVATYGEKDFYVDSGNFDDYIPKPIYVFDLQRVLKTYNTRCFGLGSSMK